jgi:hypothetical protein
MFYRVTVFAVLLFIVSAISVADHMGSSNLPPKQLDDFVQQVLAAVRKGSEAANLEVRCRGLDRLLRDIENSEPEQDGDEAKVAHQKKIQELKRVKADQERLLRALDVEMRHGPAPYLYEVYQESYAVHLHRDGLSMHHEEINDLKERVARLEKAAASGRTSEESPAPVR